MNAGWHAATHRGVVDCARWMNQQATPRCAAPAARYPTATGVAGVDAGWRTRVAVLSGMPDLAHPDLAGARTSVWPDHRTVVRGTPDDTSTAEAALLVGQGHAQIRGLVPAAHLLVAPVRATAHPRDETLCRAISWAVSEGAHLIVLPFGRRRLGRGLGLALRRAVAAGVSVLACVEDPDGYAVAFPASVTGVLAVTGADHDDPPARCGRRADLVAPSADVPGAGRDDLRPIHGAAVATVLAAGAQAAARSELALALHASVHGATPITSADPLQAVGEARERHRLVEA